MWLWLLLLFCCRQAAGQERMEEQLENEAARGHVIPKEITFSTRLSLNTADSITLQALDILTPQQLHNFLQYRRQLGPFISMYELQAVPGFNTALIARLLPYVQTNNELQHFSWRNGQHMLTMHYDRQLEKSKGYIAEDSTGPHYQGSPDQWLLRYRYSVPHNISAGFLMQKDAGEHGVDFYSAHLFISNHRHIKALALGDFTVNIGQGLLCWQSFSFGKGSSAMQVYKEGEILKPYTAADEALFYRGLGLTLKYGNWQYTAFLSRNTLDADSTASSVIINSGYHRSLSEIAKKHTSYLLAAGVNIRYEKSNAYIDMHLLHHIFSKPILPKQSVYNRYVFSGKKLHNIGADYGITVKNTHFFGELAISDNHALSLLQGILLSCTKQLDWVWLLRYYDKAYRAIYPAAFGEHANAANETGCYTGFSLKIRGWKLEAYGDVYRFPWLQYRLTSPGTGNELNALLTYTPDKYTSLSFRYRCINKEQDTSGSNTFIQPAISIKQQSLRCEVMLKTSIQGAEQKAPALSIKLRVELNASNTERGLLFLTETNYHKKNFTITLRYCRFVTGGTASSIYVLSNNKVSQLYGNGLQYQCNINWKITKAVQAEMCVQKTIYPAITAIGSSWDAIDTHHKTQLACILRHLF